LGGFIVFCSEGAFITVAHGVSFDGYVDVWTEKKQTHLNRASECIPLATRLSLLRNFSKMFNNLPMYQFLKCNPNFIFLQL